MASLTEATSIVLACSCEPLGRDGLCGCVEIGLHP